MIIDNKTVILLVCVIYYFSVSDEVTSLLLNGENRLDPCLLLQTPVVWEFNPDYVFPVSFLDVSNKSLLLCHA